MYDETILSRQVYVALGDFEALDVLEMFNKT